jgi:hypothetical protein
VWRAGAAGRSEERGGERTDIDWVDLTVWDQTAVRTKVLKVLVVRVHCVHPILLSERIPVWPCAVVW